MLSRANSVGWMGDGREGGQNSWNVVDNSGENRGENVGGGGGVVHHDVGVGGSAFRTMLEVETEWYNHMGSNNTSATSLNFSSSNNNNSNTGENMTENLLLNQAVIDSSSSCSPSPSVVFNHNSLDPSQISFLFPPKGNIFSNNLSQSFNLGDISGGGFFQDGQSSHQISGGVLGGFGEFGGGTHNQMGGQNLCGSSQFSTGNLVQLIGNEGFGSDSSTRFRGFEDGLINPSSLFVNRGSKLLKPLDNSAPAGAQPTLFQKRAALRKNFTGGETGENSSGNLLNSGIVSGDGDNVKLNSGGENDKKRKIAGGLGILDNVSFDGSGFNYDSDDFTENNNFSNMKGGEGSGKNGGTNSNPNSSVTGTGGGGAGGGDFKGKKKGLPAKNLMAERRRRKKLNDRLYMLRSVVPKISKMDRASILGDAIEYLKELLQKINDLHNELESSPPTSSLTQNTNFHPLTPTLPNLPSRIKEELCPSSLPSPNGQPARIEVRLREGRAVNIHMFCGRRPGLLLSTMRALDGLGLDIQQAVISCFNGFAMDIFRAEQCKDAQDVHPEQIKALLLDLATFHGSNVVGNCNM